MNRVSAARLLGCLLSTVGCAAHRAAPSSAAPPHDDAAAAPEAPTTVTPDATDNEPSPSPDVIGGGAPETALAVDAEVDQPSFVAGPCKAELCESFEDVPVGSPPNPALWTTDPGIIVDDLHPALDGKKSLHIPPLKAGSKFITEKKTIPGGGKVFYGRVFMWFDRLPIEKPGLYHWTAIQPVGANGMALRIGGHIHSDGRNWIRFNPGGGGGPNGETGLSDLTAVLDAKRWHCLEFFFDTPNNESRIWLDGQERPVLHWKDSVPGWHFPVDGITSIAFGFAEYQAAVTPFELFLDEIALDANRIGCDAPPPVPASNPSTLTSPAAGQGNGVPCGGATCAAGQMCCSNQTNGPFVARCLAGGATCEAPSAQIRCDGPEDCPGQQCCVENLSQISGCQASCASGTFAQLCHAQGDCPQGQMCCPSGIPPVSGIRYNVCKAGAC